MASWSDLETSAPEIAAHGKALLDRAGSGEVLLVTVSGDAPPQVHPISVRIVDGGLYAFILPSPKLRDLRSDGRYALHAYFDPAHPDEFFLNGRVREVAAATRSRLASDWLFNPGDAPAFEFLIDEALAGKRATADDWPPKYSTWKASQPVR